MSDVNNLEKENIELESTKIEFNEISQKIIMLGQRIEKEINEIDKLYEKTNEDLSNYYKEKHEKLIKEEKDLKDILDNKVTKTKEILENFYSLSNNEVKTIEKINKGIVKIEKEEKNYLIKKLTYISKMNKNMKEMKKLLQESINSLKINFIKEEGNIKYEEFSFKIINIPIPQNIEFNKVTCSSLNISWKINDDKDKNNQIKFIVEMSKKNEKFYKVYEGINSNCSINNLKNDTEYQFRICSTYFDICGSWSEIKTIRTNSVHSAILAESKREKEFLRKIFEWSGHNNMELIYRGTRDGMTCNSFHNNCDDQGKTITLIKNDKGYIFGGYSSISWGKDDDWHSAPDSFIFTLTNIHNTQPTKFNSRKDNFEIAHFLNNGPRFGGGTDISISKDFKDNKNYSKFPSTYIDTLGKGLSIFTGDLNNKNINFNVNEIEVFKINNM